MCRCNYLFFFKGDIGPSGVPGERGVQGDPGKAGEKVRKYIFLHVKAIDERIPNSIFISLQSCSDKQFILGEGMGQ